MKLTTKLILAFLLLSIIPVTVVGYLTYNHSQRTIKQDKLDDLVSVNILKAGELRNWVYNKETTLEKIAFVPQVSETLAPVVSYDPGQPEYIEASNLIRVGLGQMAGDLGVTELSVLRPSDGITVFSTNEKNMGQSRENEPYFIQGKTMSYAQSIFDPSTLEPLGMIIGMPITDVKGNLVCVIASSLDMSEISNMLVQTSGKSQTQNTYLISDSGLFITTPRLGKEYMANKATRAEGEMTALTPNSDILGSYGSYKNYRGVSVIGACQWLPEWGWYIQTEIDQSEALKPIHDLRNILIAIGSIVAVFVAVLALFFSRTITRPLRRLANGVAEIGRGNMDYRVGTPSKDEIGDLSRSFDSMAENLKATTVSRDDLEQEVAERKQAHESLIKEKNFSESAINSLPGVFYLFNKDIKFLRWNRNFEEVSGYSSREMSVMSPLDLIDPEDRGTVAETIGQVFAEGKASVEAKLLSKNGDKTLYYFTGLRMIIDGAPYCLGSGIDITERKRIEQEVRDKNDLLKTQNEDLRVIQEDLHSRIKDLAKARAYSQGLLDSMSDSLLVADLKGNVVDVNDAYLKMMGWVKEEVMEMSLAQLAQQFRPEEQEYDVARVDKLVRGGAEGISEVAIVNKAGNRLILSISPNTVKDDRGNPLLMFFMIRDVTVQRAMEQEVRDKNERLETQNEELRGTQEDLHSKIEDLAKARAYSQSLFDSMSDGLIVTDLKGKVIDVNDAHLRRMGFVREEVVGFSLGQLASKMLGPEERENALVRHDKFERGGVEGITEVSVVNKAGDPLILSTSRNLVKDDHGKPILMFSVLRDVTVQKAIERELKESEALYSAMANSSQVGVYIVQDGNFVFANPQFLKHVGFETGGLLGMHSLDLVHPDDRAKVREKTIEALKGGDASPHEYRIVTKSGEVRVFLETVASIQYKGQRASLGTQIDTTERKRVEEDLKKSEELFRSVSEAANDAIITADSNGNIVLSNRAAETIFGYSGEELAGKEIIQLMPEGFRGTFKKEMSLLISKATTSASGKMVEAIGIKKDGSKFPAELSRATWWTKNGFFFTAIVRDITERKQMESKLDVYWAQLEQKLVELQLAYQQLKELDQMKDKFLSTVSHELRTPLTSIKSFAEILLNYEEDRETQKEFLGIINEECDRLTRLINDFLDLAKIEAGRMQWQDAELAIAQVIEKSLGATKGLVEKKGLIVTVDFEPDLPPVLADKDRLLQVVTNLLSNSIKFTPEGGKLQVGAGIVKKTGDTPEMIRVSVSDSGIGIAPENHQTIFEKFSQVGDTLRDKPQGTGLGLPICKEIVEHYNGRVWVESELGKGSTFYFTLPTVSKTEPEAAEEAKAEPVSAPRKKGKTILVVDDEEHIRRFLSHELAKRGFSVIEASDGKEAIEKAREHRPALITLDVLMLPGIDGFDVTAVLKNNPDTKDIPILIVSVMEDKEKAYRLGVNDYVTKPFEIETLMAKITGLMQQPQKSILLVDDDRALTKSIKYELEKRGFSISVAYNGKQALEMVDVLAPDLILLDIMMPEMDGYEVIKALKTNAVTTNIPIVVMTGMEIDGGRVKVLSLGANEYITKSGGLDKLYGAIDSIMDLGSEDG